MKQLFVTTILLLFLTTTQAQNWMNYTCGYEIYEMAEENDTLWIGTSGGLMKYVKSTGAKTFYNRGNSDIPNNWVQAITIDTNGDKWLGTKKGLAQFDGVNWTFWDDTNSPIPYNNVSSVGIDPLTGDIWLGTIGISHFDGSTWTTWTTSNSNLPNNNVHDIEFESNGDIWVGTSSGLSTYNGSSWINYAYSSGVHDVDIDGLGNKWMATFGNGVHRRGPSGNWQYTSSNSDLNTNSIVALDIDASDVLWIGTQNELHQAVGANWPTWNTGNTPSVFATWGVMREVFIASDNTLWVGLIGRLAHYNTSTWDVVEDTVANSGLSDNFVLSVAIDSAGIVWGGTKWGGGLNRFNTIDTSWNNYNTNNSNLADNWIYHQIADGNGNIWLGHGYGMSRFNGTTFTNYTPANSNVADDKVRSLDMDSQGNVWYATYGGGIGKFNGSTFTNYNTGNSGLPGSLNYYVLAGIGDTIWIGTNSDGLVRFDGTNWTIWDTGNSGIPSNTIVCLAQDSLGHIWLGSYWGGLTYFDGTNFTTWNSSNSPLTSDNVHTIEIDKNGVIWFSSDGLWSYDGITFTHYDTYNSQLSMNQVNDIEFDQFGNIWIATGNDLTGGGGINLFNPTGIVYPPNAAVTASTAPLCFGSCDGAATVTPTGGTPPYSYDWGANAGNQADSTATGLCAGTYTVTMTDNNGLIFTTAVNLSEPSAITSNFISNNVSCNGGCDAIVTVNPSGGTPGYTYNWTHGPTTAAVTGLCAGAYAVTITDGNGCTGNNTVTITEPTLLSINSVTTTDANGSCNGTVNPNITGGTPPYNETWTPTISNPNNVCAGTYNLLITDANGCTDTITVVIQDVTGIIDNGLGIKGNVFPNPVVDELIVQLELPEEQQLQIELYAVSGEQIRSENLSASKNTVHRFDVRELSAGIYSLVVTGNEFVWKEKVIVGQ